MLLGRSWNFQKVRWLDRAKKGKKKSKYLLKKLSKEDEKQKKWQNATRKGRSLHGHVHSVWSWRLKFKRKIIWCLKKKQNILTLKTCYLEKNVTYNEKKTSQTKIEVLLKSNRFGFHLEYMKWKKLLTTFWQLFCDKTKRRTPQRKISKGKILSLYISKTMSCWGFWRSFFKTM